MGALNLLDFIIITPLVFGLARGLYKGFVNELASLVALVGGILVAHAYADNVFVILSNYVEEPGTGVRILSYVLVFTLVVVVVFVLSRAITKMLGMLSLGLLNRLLGGIFGFCKMLLILLILTHFLHPFLNAGGYYEKPFFTESSLFNYLLEYKSLLEGYFRMSIPDENPLDRLEQASV